MFAGGYDNGAAAGAIDKTIAARMVVYLGSKSFSWFGDQNHYLTGNSYAAFNPYLTLNAGWVISTTIGPSYVSAGGGWMFNSTTTNSLDFAPPIPFNAVRVWYTVHSTNGSFTGAFGGGAASAPVNTSGADGFSSFLLTSGSSAAMQTFHLTPTATAAINIVGMTAYDAAQPTLHVLNLGYYGAKASDYLVATDPWSPFNAVKAIAPDLSFIMFGANEILNNYNPYTYGGDLRTFTSGMQASGDTIICREPQMDPAHNTPQTDPANQSLFGSIERGVASQTGSLMVDLKRRSRNYAALSAAGGIVDPVHPNGLWADDTGYLFSEIALS